MSTPSGGSHRDLAEAVMSELRALSTAQDRLDQYAAHRFGINRTDLRALDLIGQAGINRRHQHRARPAGGGRLRPS
jgi:hypothetical protein